jgi:20S proteasome alpha/beta subunit
VEYAIEAIKLGSTAIGIQTDEGVILAVEKRITSPLMEPTSIEKVSRKGLIQRSTGTGSKSKVDNETSHGICSKN